MPFVKYTVIVLCIYSQKPRKSKTMFVPKYFDKSLVKVSSHKYYMCNI